jgi:hypothetical protein
MKKMIPGLGVRRETEPGCAARMICGAATLVDQAAKNFTSDVEGRII